MCVCVFVCVCLCLRLCVCVELLAALAFDCIRFRQDKRPAGMVPVLERLRAVRAVVDAAGAVPLRHCVVCLEDVDARAGIACGGGGGHFVCRGCLPGTVNFNLEPRRLKANRGRVKCPGEGCGHMWEMADFGDRLDAATHVAYGNALRYEAFDAADARRAAEAELAAREAAARDARLALAERARQHRGVIAERDLLLRCPRCAFPFDDYDGCNALTCRRCGCGFCALCLTDCGADAHTHYGATHAGDIFNRPRFEETHRQRRINLVVRAVRALAGEGADLQRAVLGELSVDMRDLGIDEAAVAAAVFRAGGAGVAAAAAVGAAAAGDAAAAVAGAPHAAAAAANAGDGVIARALRWGVGLLFGGGAAAARDEGPWGALVRDLRRGDPRVQLEAARQLRRDLAAGDNGGRAPTGVDERSRSPIAGRLVAIAAAGAIGPLVALLRSPSDVVVQNVAACLCQLALNGALAFCPVRSRARSPLCMSCDNAMIALVCRTPGGVVSSCSRAQGHDCCRGRHRAAGRAAGIAI